MKQIEPWMSEYLEMIEEPSILLSAQEREERLEEKRFVKLFMEAEDLSRLCFSKVRFENCSFINCSLQKCEFTDVIFINCNLSNCVVTDAYINRCQILSSKGTGANFSGGSIQNLLIRDGNFNYSNFDACKLEKIRVENSELKNANISQCRCREVEWERVQFCQASFFHTSLNKMDFTTCVIDGLILADDFRELKGAVVDMYQAAELAKRLGIVIK